MRLIRPAAVLLLFAGEVRAAPWPAADAVLTAPPVVALPAKARPIRIAIDAGHGAPGNTGNRDVRCRDEADHMLVVADALVARLAKDSRFVVKALRTGTARPRYQARVKAAQAFRAEAILSLHSDARGAAEWWFPESGGPACLRNDAEPGIGVLLSDEGSKALVGKRLSLARALAARFSEAGFPLYDGSDWTTLYRFDDRRGVYYDDRPKKQRVFMLRQRTVPAVIIETHHALDDEENTRWHEERTFDVFAAAVAAALVDALRPR